MRYVKATFKFPVTHDDAYRFSDQPQEFKVLFDGDDPYFILKICKYTKIPEVVTTIGALPLHRFISEPGHKAIFVEGLSGREVFERIKSLGPDKTYTMEPQTKLSKKRDFARLIWKVY